MIQFSPFSPSCSSEEEPFWTLLQICQLFTHNSHNNVSRIASSVSILMKRCCHMKYCVFPGVGGSVHTRRRPHRPVLSDYGSGCWRSYVRSTDLQPGTGDQPRPDRRRQVGRPDSSRDHPGQSHRQCYRFVFEYFQ